MWAIPNGQVTGARPVREEAEIEVVSLVRTDLLQLQRSVAEVVIIEINPLVTRDLLRREQVRVVPNVDSDLVSICQLFSSRFFQTGERATRLAD